MVDERDQRISIAVVVNAGLADVGHTKRFVRSPFGAHLDWKPTQQWQIANLKIRPQDWVEFFLSNTTRSRSLR